MLWLRLFLSIFLAFGELFSLYGAVQDCGLGFSVLGAG